MPLLASADEKKRRAKINQIKHAKITKKRKLQRNKTSRVNKQEIDQKCPDNTRCKHVYVIV